MQSGSGIVTSVNAISIEQAGSQAAPENGRTPYAYVPEIDGLRAIAMSVVVLQHCALAPFGWLGVWLFYVISGFAITTSLLGARRTENGPFVTIRNFLVRRAIRIWPIYFLFIAFVSAIAFSWGRTDFTEAVWLAGFIYNFKIIAEGVSWIWVGHLWTISVEEHFYLVYPFIFALLWGRTRVLALWALVILAPLIRLAMSPIVGQWDFTPEQKAVAVYMFSPAHFDAFALGALIALGRPHIEGRIRWALAALAGAAVLALGYTAYGIWLNVQEGAQGLNLLRNIYSGILWGGGRQVFVYLAVTWSAAAVLFATVAGLPVLKRLLSPSWLQAIGRISFGAYVFHMIVIGHVSAYLLPWATEQWDPLRQLGLFAIAYPATLALAALSFRFIEQPFLKLRKRFA